MRKVINQTAYLSVRMVRSSIRSSYGERKFQIRFLSTSTNALPSDASEVAEDSGNNDDDEFDLDEGEDNMKDGPTNNQVRLCKLISETGYCSRRTAEKLIREKRVALKGKIISDPTHLTSIEDLKYIELDDIPLRRRYKGTAQATGSASTHRSKEAQAMIASQRKDYPFLYPRLWAAVKYRFESMNAREAPDKKRSTMLSRLTDILPRIFHPNNPLLRPVYRLPYKSEGLTLYTNNGELARLFHSDKVNFLMTYRIRMHGKLSPEKLTALEQGKIHDAQSGQKLVTFEEIYVTAKANTNTWLTVTTKERDVQKIEKTFNTLYLQCTRIICVGIGPYQLGEIFPGLYRANASNQKRKKLADVKKESERERQNQLQEIEVVKELHKPFFQLQNQKISRGTVKATSVKQQLQQ